MSKRVNNKKGNRTVRKNMTRPVTLMDGTKKRVPCQPTKVRANPA